ncbi:MAG: hypothetical protein NC310_09220, partial [Roseburia sp.]|nr:hypothetical protein [Roseburia sp.]
MENKSLNQLEKLEQERSTINKKSKIGYIVAFGLIAVGVATFFWIPFLLFVFMIIGIIIIVVTSMQVNKFKKKFKELVVTKLIKDELGVDAVYRMNDGLSIQEINSLKVASAPDRYRMEDYISCTYNGVPYEMCDCVLEERHETTDGQGHTQTSYQTYFKGRIIKIDFQRDLPIELKVVNHPVQGFQYKPLLSFETEVIDFNK